MSSPRRTIRPALPVPALAPLPALALALLVTIALLSLTGCGGGASGDSPASPNASGGVAIEDFAFGPERLTIAAGTGVEFANHDSTAHTATAKDGSAFDTGTIGPGKTKSIRLERPGTYTYYCVFHPFMKGTIVVDAP